MQNKITILKAVTEQDYLAARALIVEYVQWLGMDLSFQNFDHEMNTLDTTYSSPDGGLFIAFKNEAAVGVGGIKRFSNTECEVKRMFVQPAGRGLGIGKLLLTDCIELARQLKYKTIKLDTADFMQAAIKLYVENGFTETIAYRFNPHEQARYFELQLEQRD